MGFAHQRLADTIQRWLIGRLHKYRKGVIRLRAKITELREKRASAFEAMKGISEAAEERGEALTAEETQEYQRHSDELDTLTERIERLEREEGIAPGMARTVLTDVDPEREAHIAKREGRVTGTDEYRDAFDGYVRARGSVQDMRQEQRVALAVGADAQGGFLVPDEFYRNIVAKAQEVGNIRPLATVITTAENGDVLIPKENSFATVTWLAEGAAYTQTEPDFAQAILKAYKAGLISKVSDELIADSAFDVLSFLADRIGTAFGKESNKQYVSGASGSTTTPEGVVNKATTGVTLPTGNTTSITTDGIIDLYHSVIDPYRSAGVWLALDATVKAIRKLKDTTNQYLWQPGLQAGQPDSLLGRPVLVDPNVPTMAASAKSLLFGDLSGYWIRDVSSLNLKVLNELYAANGQIGVRADLRTDGDLIDTDAVKVLVNSAT